MSENKPHRVHKRRRCPVPSPAETGCNCEYCLGLRREMAREEAEAERRRRAMKRLPGCEDTA